MQGPDHQTCTVVADRDPVAGIYADALLHGRVVPVPNAVLRHHDLLLGVLRADPGGGTRQVPEAQLVRSPRTART